MCTRVAVEKWGFRQREVVIFLDFPIHLYINPKGPGGGLLCTKRVWCWINREKNVQIFQNSSYSFYNLYQVELNNKQNRRYLKVPHCDVIKLTRSTFLKNKKLMTSSQNAAILDILFYMYSTYYILLSRVRNNQMDHFVV